MTSLVTSAVSEEPRSMVPFGQAASAVMVGRRIGVRQLALQAGISPSYLSRVLRDVDGKRASLKLIRRVTEALELPEQFFIETRRSKVVALLEADPGLTDRVECFVRE